MRPPTTFEIPKKSILTLKFYNIIKAGTELQKLSQKYKNLQYIYYLLITIWSETNTSELQKDLFLHLTELKASITVEMSFCSISFSILALPLDPLYRLALPFSHDWGSSPPPPNVMSWPRPWQCPLQTSPITQPWVLYNTSIPQCHILLIC